MEDDINPLKQEMKLICEKVNIFTSKMEDMENRLRSNNVRVVGPPERNEGSNPMGFMEKWFTYIFVKESFHHSLL